MEDIYVSGHKPYLIPNGSLPTLTSETLGEGVLRFHLWSTWLYVAIAWDDLKDPLLLNTWQNIVLQGIIVHCALCIAHMGTPQMLCAGDIIKVFMVD